MAIKEYSTNGWLRGWDGGRKIWPASYFQIGQDENGGEISVARAADADRSFSLSAGEILEAYRQKARQASLADGDYVLCNTTQSRRYTGEAFVDSCGKVLFVAQNCKFGLYISLTHPHFFSTPHSKYRSTPCAATRPWLIIPRGSDKRSTRESW